MKVSPDLACRRLFGTRPTRLLNDHSSLSLPSGGRRATGSSAPCSSSWPPLRSRGSGGLGLTAPAICGDEILQGTAAGRVGWSARPAAGPGVRHALVAGRGGGVFLLPAL